MLWLNGRGASGGPPLVRFLGEADLDQQANSLPWSRFRTAKTRTGHRAFFVTRGKFDSAGGAASYSSDWMALSNRKRIAPSLLVSAITKRTRPCWEVSA